jgi:hypothetical protein
LILIFVGKFKKSGWIDFQGGLGSQGNDSLQLDWRSAGLGRRVGVFVCQFAGGYGCADEFDFLTVTISLYTGCGFKRRKFRCKKRLGFHNP